MAVNSRTPARLRRALSSWQRRAAQSEALARELQSQLAEQRRFVAMAAHDLRSPLQTINVALAVLAADAAQPMHKPLSLARRAVTQAGDRLTDLVRAAQLGQAEPVSLSTQRVCLRQLVEQCADEARLRFPGRVLQLEAKSGPAWVDVDVARMTQVLDNLISNALLHSPEHSPVTLQLKSNERFVELNVSNLGAIPDCVRPRLFQPMNRGSESSHPGSMGLGLYIVRRLVEAHAGRVEVLSEGQRTTFTVRLSRADA